MMVRCTKCGSENAEDSRFCTSCGAALVPLLPSAARRMAWQRALWRGLALVAVIGALGYAGYVWVYQPWKLRQQALRLLDEAIQICTEEIDDEGRVPALGAIAFAQAMAGQKDKARETLQDFVRGFRGWLDSDDPREEAVIALLQAGAELDDEAKSTIQQALQKAEELYLEINEFESEDGRIPMDYLEKYIVGLVGLAMSAIPRRRRDSMTRQG